MINRIILNLTTKNKRKNISECKALVFILLIYFFIFIQVNHAFSQNSQADSSTVIPASTGPLMVLQPGLGIRYKINKKIRLYQYFRSYNYLNDKTRNFEEISFGATYNIGKINRFYFTSTLGYLLTLGNIYNIHEFRPKFYFTTSYHLNHARLEFQNRLEYRLKIGGNSGASLRYRPRFLVGLQYNLGKFQLSPYIYDELFIGENGFSEHRTKLALSVRYENLSFTAGNLFKIKRTKGFVENRTSLDISYTIPTRKKIINK
ncbi:MAG: hypothetical protein D4R64_13410 [Porphyromonadaceae bacterium]|nr:MAG: hypothetical protein D4R64_13410 [Porphyromonadaceae bacterium]